MSGFLHSLPWTIALALAQAGEAVEGGPVALPLEAGALFVSEDRMSPNESSDPSSGLSPGKSPAVEIDEDERTGLSPDPLA